jgi:hypothetical protein
MLMKAYLCRWPNGDLSIAVAPNRLGADTVLDEQDNPDCAEILPVNKAFAIHFTLQNPRPKSSLDSALAFDSLPFSEELLDEFQRAYPVLGEVLAREDATQEMIDQAVEQEKSPIYDREPELSEHSGVAAVQTELQMPRSLAESLAGRIVNDEDEADEDEPEDGAERIDLKAHLQSVVDVVVAACEQHRHLYLSQSYTDSPAGGPGLVTLFASCPEYLAVELRTALDSTARKFLIDHGVDPGHPPV